MRRGGPRSPLHAMADSATSFTLRSPGSSPGGSTARTRTRAASSGDERGSVRTAADSEARQLRTDAAEADEGATQFDPRQGTLLGFELPPDAFASMLGAVARGDGGPAALSEDGATPGSEAAAEEAPAAESAPLAGNSPAVVNGSDAPGALGTQPAAQALDPAQIPTPQEILAAIEQALRPREPATARKTGAAKAASLKRAVGPTPAAAVPLAVSAELAQPQSMLRGDAPPAAELVRTVALLQASIADDRYAAQERWRRTRRWFAIALAALALLFAFSVAQTVALIASAERQQTAQQLVQAALIQQQAALANLARAASALSGSNAARPASASGAAATAPVNAAPEPVQHARAAHARHPKEKAKPAAQQ